MKTVIIVAETADLWFASWWKMLSDVKKTNLSKRNDRKFILKVQSVSEPINKT